MANRAHLWQLIQDASGNPLPNVSVEVRAVGTTTPIAATALYADRDGSTTLPANPVTADSRGIVEFWMDTPQRVDLNSEGVPALLKDVPVLNPPQEVQLADHRGTAAQPSLTFAHELGSGLSRDTASGRVVMATKGSEVTAWVRDATIPDFDAKTFVVNNPGYTTGGQHTLVVSRTDHAGPVGHVMADLQYITRAVKGPTDPFMTDSSVARIWGTVADGDSQIRAIEAQVIRLAGANNATTAADFNTVNGYPPDTGELLDDRTTTGLKVSQHAGLSNPPAARLSTTFPDANQNLTYLARAAGPAGDDITIEYVEPVGETAGETVSVSGKAITVTLRRVSGMLSTAAQVKAAIEASQAASALVCVRYRGGANSSGQVAAMSPTLLAGGNSAGWGSGCTSYLPDVTPEDARKYHGTALMLWGDMGWASYLRCYNPDMGSGPANQAQGLEFDIQRGGHVTLLGDLVLETAARNAPWRLHRDADPTDLLHLAGQVDKLTVDWLASGDVHVLPAPENSGKLLVGPTPAFRVDTSTNNAAVAGGLAVGSDEPPAGCQLYVKDPAGGDVNICLDTSTRHNTAVRFQEAEQDKWVFLRDSTNAFSLYDMTSGLPAIAASPGSPGVRGGMSIMPSRDARVGICTPANAAYNLWIDGFQPGIRLDIQKIVSGQLTGGPDSVPALLDHPAGYLRIYVGDPENNVVLAKIPYYT
jgi:hypothetical protein